MAANNRARLRRIEEAIAPSQRIFVVNERDGDVEKQVKRLRDEEGLTDRDLVVILKHFGDEGLTQ